MPPVIEVFMARTTCRTSRCGRNLNQTVQDHETSRLVQPPVHSMAVRECAAGAGGQGALGSHATSGLKLRARDDPHATTRDCAREAFWADDVYGAGDGAD